MQGYHYAPEGNASVQNIPYGFDGHDDWDVVDDVEKAKRGWVRADPPVVNLDWERWTAAFKQGEDGAWGVAYTVGPGDPGRARVATSDAIQARRDVERDKGVSVEVGGETYTFHTDAASLANYTGSIALAREYEAEKGEGTFRTAWRAKGAYVKGGMDLSDLVRVGVAAGLYVAQVFARAGAIEAATLRKQRSDTIRSSLEAEIGKGWPGEPAEEPSTPPAPEAPASQDAAPQDTAPAKA